MQSVSALPPYLWHLQWQQNGMCWTHKKCNVAARADHQLSVRSPGHVRHSVQKSEVPRQFMAASFFVQT